MPTDTRTVDDLSALPAPPKVPLPSLLQAPMFPFRHRIIPRLQRRYGDVFAIELLPGQPGVVLADPDHIRIVFTGRATTFHAGEGNMILAQVMGERSVLTTDEDEHHRIRKLLMPPFHGAPMRGYRDMVTGLAVDEVTHWPIGTPFASHQRMNAIAMEIILRVVFGLAEGSRLDELRNALTRLLSRPIVEFAGGPVPQLRRFGPWKRFAAMLAHIDVLLCAEIAERRRVPDLAERTDVLSQLLVVEVDGDRLTDDELRDQLITLLLAGHETTANALAWTFHELARNPAVHARATRAADEGDEKYLEAVAKESMRLHPVVYQVARRLTEDVAIGGYRIPAGHLVFPSIGLVQSDPRYHDDPKRFRPERFVDGSATPANWFPFGGGVRRCLGAGFSLMEATIILREILTRYRIEPDRQRPEATKSRNITLTPARGARIIVHRR